MSSVTELERLIVRLVGDSSNFERMAKRVKSEMQTLEKHTAGVKKQSQQTATQVKRFGGDIQRGLTPHVASANTSLGAMSSTIKTRANVAMAEFGQQLRNLKPQIGGMARSLIGLAASFAGIGFLRSSIMGAGKFEQVKISMETLLGSAEEAEQQLRSLTEFGAKTPFSMPQINRAAKQLNTFGDRGKEVTDTLRILGNAASGTSSSFGMITQIFNQVRGVGKLLQQDFRQLSTRGVIFLQDIANHFDTTKAKAQEMMSAGEISFRDFRKILKGLSEDGGRFAGQMEKQSQSLIGAIEKLKGNFRFLKIEIGKALLPVIKSTTSALTAMTEILKTLPTWITAPVAVLGSLALAIGGVAIASSIAGPALLAAAGAIKAVTLASLAFMATPIGAAVTALGLAAAAAAYYFDLFPDFSSSAKDAAKAQGDVNKELKETNTILSAVNSEQYKAINFAKEMSKATEEQTDKAQQHVASLKEQLAFERHRLSGGTMSRERFTAQEQGVSKLTLFRMKTYEKKLREIKELEDARDKATKIRESLVTPYEEAVKEIKEIKRLTDQGLLSDRTATRAISKVVEETKEELGGVKDEIKKVDRAYQNSILGGTDEFFKGRVGTKLEAMSGRAEQIAKNRGDTSKESLQAASMQVINETRLTPQQKRKDRDPKEEQRNAMLVKVLNKLDRKLDDVGGMPNQADLDFMDSVING